MDTHHNHSGYVFPEEAMVSYAALLLGGLDFGHSVYGAVQARPDHVVLLARSAEGRNVRLVAPLCEFAAGVVSFRSILKALPGEAASWDADGRPVHGCVALVHFGERCVRLAASRDSISSHMRSGTPAPHQHPAGYREDVECMLAGRLSRGIYGEFFETVDGDRRVPLALQTELALAG